MAKNLVGSRVLGVISPEFIRSGIFWLFFYQRWKWS